jgi:hypothetical protein
LVDAQTDGAGTLLLAAASPGKYRLISQLGEAAFEIRSGDANDRLEVELDDRDEPTERK